MINIVYILIVGNECLVIGFAGLFTASSIALIHFKNL